MQKKFALILAAIAVVGLSACGGGNKAAESPSASPSASSSPSASPSGSAASPSKAPEGNATIVFQSWVTPNLTAEFYDGIIAKFEKANPGIKVKRIQPPANEGNADNYLKTLLASGDFPDVIQNATVPLFVEADALREIPIDDDIKQINNYESDLIKGKLYQVTSAGSQPQSLIFYNKKLFADAGITALPKTWADLEDVSAKLKAKGITPLLTAGDWTAGFTFTSMTSPTVFQNKPVWYTDRFDGKAKFTDANWLEAANYFNGLVQKGYFNKGASSIDYAAVEQEFLKGNGAMYPMGIWFTAAETKAKKNFEVGVFPAPTKDGKQFILGYENGGGVSISKKSKNPEAALKFAKFLMLDRDNNKALLQTDGLFSTMKNPVVWDMSPLQKEVSNLLTANPPMNGFYNGKVGSVPVSGIQDQYNKVAQNMLLGKADVTKEMQTLDDYWEKNKK
ncbi:MAG: extracellular solute-binding protein [Paenibacillaceae bacterium]|nr:extracellular solute-binding protein [Paenibacillaceae bacterium]